MKASKTSKIVIASLLSPLVGSGMAAGATAQAAAPPGAVLPSNAGAVKPTAAPISAETKARIRALAVRLSAAQASKAAGTTRTPPAGSPGTLPQPRAQGTTGTAPQPAPGGNQDARPPYIPPEVLRIWAQAGALHRQAIEHENRGEWDQAVRCFEESEAMDPDDKSNDYGLARCAAAAGDLDSEVTFYRRAIYMLPPAVGYRDGAPGTLMKFCLLLSQDRQPEEALLVYNFAVQRANYKRDDLTKAWHLRDDGEELIPVLGPGGIPFTLQRMQALAMAVVAYSEQYNLGDHKGALVHYREAVRLAPELALPHFYLAESLDGRGSDAAEKAAEYRLALQIGLTGQRARDRATAQSQSLAPAQPAAH